MASRAWIAKVFAFLLAAVASTRAVPDAPSIYARGYFGESVGGLSREESARFDRGFALFAKNWSKTGTDFARNASSCVTCHSVPAPGGAGMSNDALVPIAIVDGRTEVHQRLAPRADVKTLPGHARFRRTPSLFGLGLLEAAAPTRDGAKRPIFGARAENNSLEDFVARAFAVELGVSSTAHCAREGLQAPYPEKCSARISVEEIADVSAFIRYLAAPPPSRRDSTSRGQKVFVGAKCNACHQEVLEAAEDAVGPLAGRLLLAYTDLRLHDLGEGPVKTAALWGVNSLGPPYMHHGRAQSVEQAIEQHGGDAGNSKERYRRLSTQDRRELIRFLKSL